MNFWFMDYESFYSREYSLRKMTPPEYILHPLFECMGCAFKEGANGAPFWVDGPDLPKFFAGIDKDKAAFVSHNALFDACITAWRYNTTPRLLVDTLGMSRATLGHVLKSHSLASVARHLGLGVKGDTLLKVEGMTSADIKAAGLWQQYTDYALNDVELCAQIFTTLRAAPYSFPTKELVVKDAVLRCAINPKFHLDQDELHNHLYAVQRSKELLLQQVGPEREELMSNDKFALALMQLGVDPPRKTSLLTGKETWAFAKTDHEFVELEEHENIDVQQLVAARLGLKTTLEETRTQKFINIGRVTWPGNRQGLMPIPLRYAAAHTHRLGGEWKINMQNLPRGGALRRALIAPPDHLVLAPDSAQIEARIVAWICGQADLVKAFADGEDVYSSFASEVFGFPVNKKDNPKERFIGKTSILGLGFGMGWPKFQNTVKVQSRNELGEVIELTDAQALNNVATYRRKYRRVERSWGLLGERGIKSLASGGKFEFGPCVFEKGAILLPNGLRLHYHDLKRENNEWSFTYAGKPKRLYGSKLLENMVQALARIAVMDAAVAINKRFEALGQELALQVHDELVYVVPRDIADACKAIALEEMSRRPTWAPGLPLKAEAEIGPSYGDAK